MPCFVRMNRVYSHEPGGGADAVDLRAATAQASQFLLELLPLAILFVLRDGRVVHANRCGHALLKADLRLDGEGRCCNGSASTTFVLRSKIAEAVAAGRRSEFALQRAGALPLAACVVPAPTVSGKASPIAILVVSDAERPCRVSGEFLMELFGLTPAEARFAAALGNGRRLEAIAKANSLALNTARFHLRQIFAKLDISRQADLVRLIVSGPGSLPEEQSAVPANLNSR